MKSLHYLFVHLAGLLAALCEGFDVQAAGRDLVLGMGVTFGIGYAINSTRKPIAPNPRVCYWGGWGGSLIVNDLDARMTMAYVMNRMGLHPFSDPRELGLHQALFRDVLGARAQA